MTWKDVDLKFDADWKEDLKFQYISPEKVNKVLKAPQFWDAFFFRIWILLDAKVRG